MKRLLLILFSFLPALGFAQMNECVATGVFAPTEILAHRYVKRTTINNVQSQAGTWVVGSYAGNWDTYVEQATYYGGTLSHWGSDSTQNGSSTVTFNDTPSSLGTGNYSNYNYHYAECDRSPYTFSSGESEDSQQVEAPEIGNLPAVNGDGVPSLWYFKDAPDAVPANVGYGGGYAYQYANLTYNKNCLANDTCSGNPTWSEVDPGSSITVSSSGVLKSTGPSATCGQYDASVRATLSGWTVDSLIWVNAPVGAQLPYGKSVSTDKWEDAGGETTTGYMTRHPWAVVGLCGWAIPSMAINETFGSFSEPGATSGWTVDPTASNSDRFYGSFCPTCRVYGGQYFFEDVLAAGPGIGTPSPLYTGPGPTYSYSTVIKTTNLQKWFIGIQTPNGNGTEVLNLNLKYYRDHAFSTKNP